MENFLTMVLLGLLVNLLACIIWKKWPTLARKIGRRVPWMDKVINLTFAFILLIMCVLILILTRDKSKTIAQARTPAKTEQDRPVSPGAALPVRAGTKSVGPPPVAPASGDVPRSLVALIRQYQDRYVMESFGWEAHKNYTAARARRFRDGKVLADIREELKQDREFLSIVEAMKSMRAEERQEVLARGENTYRPTWSQLELDPTLDSSDDLRGGQTEAGQEIEKRISREITGLVKSLL